MKRLRFEVRKCRGGWGFFAQRRAEPISKELVIKSRDGRIQDTRTYGEDPRRTKG